MNASRRNSATPKTAAPEWRASAEKLALGNPPEFAATLARVLADRRVVAVLPMIERALGASYGPDTRRRLLFLIASGGGWQPNETESTRAKRRRKIAGLARQLSDAMAEDPGCDRFTLEHLWGLAIGIEPTQVIYERRKVKAVMPTISGTELARALAAMPDDPELARFTMEELIQLAGGVPTQRLAPKSPQPIASPDANAPNMPTISGYIHPPVSKALGALADAIERDLSGNEVPLSHWDRRPAWNPLAAQSGRDEAPRALLERALCNFFEQYADGPHPEFVAPIVEVSLGAVETIDPDDLRRRWDKFRAR